MLMGGCWCQPTLRSQLLGEATSRFLSRMYFYRKYYKMVRGLLTYNINNYKDIFYGYSNNDRIFYVVHYR